jgi:hypothetical protein
MSLFTRVTLLIELSGDGRERVGDSDCRAHGKDYPIT